MGQSAARKKKTNKLLEAQRSNTDGKRFQESKMFHKIMFFYSKLYIQHPGDIFV